MQIIIMLMCNDDAGIGFENLKNREGLFYKRLLKRFDEIRIQRKLQIILNFMLNFSEIY